MQLELAFKAISHTIIAVFFSALVLVLLISLKNEISRGMAPGYIVHLCLAVSGICAFIALVPVDNWLRLIVWLLIGFAIYFAYGRYHSVLIQAPKKNRG